MKVSVIHFLPVWLLRCIYILTKYSFIVSATCLEGDVRLMIDEYYMADLDLDYGNLYIKDELKIGRVEVCVDGEYGSVCFDDGYIDNQEASVICWQLGFSRYGECITTQAMVNTFDVGALMTGGDLFASPLVEPALSQLNCNGSEDSIAECTNNTVDVETCSLSVAVCQGITKPNLPFLHV